MVKLTTELIARGTSSYTKKKRDEGLQHYMRRLTHLYLEDKNIDDVGDELASCRNLSVLYLYDNKLTKVPNLLSNCNLTHLYLQNNNICKVEYLNGLRRLSKLYLGGNAITILEGLEQLDSLQELYVENQKLPKGEKLLFEPRTLLTLSRCLQVFNVSGNGLDTLRDLEILQELAHFMANDNELNDMREMVHLLSSWRQLNRLELMGNPLCHKSKYRDRLIIVAPHLEMLDNKEITDTTRVFLKNWQANKEALKKKRELISRQNEMGQYAGLGDEGDLPPVNAPVKQISSVPGYIMPGLPRKQFQDVLAKSVSQPGSAMPGMRTNGLGQRTLSEFAPARFQSAGPRRRTLPETEEASALGSAFSACSLRPRSAKP